MIYYGDSREDGRIIKSHELVYKDAILNCLTGELTFPKFPILTFKIDAEPISFVYNTNNGLFVMYKDYTKLYKIDGRIIEVDDIGVYSIYGKVIDGELHYTSEFGEFVWKDYHKCKKLIAVISFYPDGSNRLIIEYNYIDHDDNFVCKSDLRRYVLMNRFFIIIDDVDSDMYIYDKVENTNFHIEGDERYPVIKLGELSIIDIKIYNDGVELYTVDGNYYINDSKLKELPDGWSLKPCFNTWSKSARKID